MTLSTTTRRLMAHGPCQSGINKLAAHLGTNVPDDEPISYETLLDVLGLDNALWCCRAEPQHDHIWRRYAVWCARQVQHLMRDERSRKALDVAERHTNSAATDEELVAARDAARAAAWAAAWAAAGAAEADAWAAAEDARDAALDAAGGAISQRQADAFRLLITTGELPHA
jgi:hypothetical protein